MGIKGFEGTLSEESKKALKALQLETWKKVRDCMKENREVRHFTAENTAENAYGWTWDQVVKEYLKSGYNAAESSLDIIVLGNTYKVLKRSKVTVFYDAAGDTLFDVTNERLEKEYGWLMNSGAGDGVENMDTKEENDAAGKDDSVVEQTEENTEAGEAPQTEQTDEDELAKQQAEEKLKKELAAAKDKSFAEPIISYLLKRCNEDEGLAEDVVQEHKTWQKCLDYIFRQAKKQAVSNKAVIRDDVVYEWAEDYYHKDDKAEEEAKARGAAERKARQAATVKKKAKAKKKPVAVSSLSSAPEKKEEKLSKQPKPKKNSKDMEGQLDIFSMLGV